MKVTHKERLRRHFAAGGAELNYLEIAAALDVSVSVASGLMTSLEHSKGPWSGVVTRTPQRTLINVTKKVTALDKKKAAIAKAMIANKSANNNSLKELFNCSITLVAGVRARLVAAGKVKEKDGRQAAGFVIPTRRHPDDEPHLAKAERIRKIWPERART